MSCKNNHTANIDNSDGQRYIYVLLFNQDHSYGIDDLWSLDPTPRVMHGSIEGMQNVDQHFRLWSTFFLLCDKPVTTTIHSYLNAHPSVDME